MRSYRGSGISGRGREVNEMDVCCWRDINAVEVFHLLLHGQDVEDLRRGDDDSFAVLSLPSPGLDGLHPPEEGFGAVAQTL